MLATLLLATLAVAGPPISLRLSNDGRYMPGDAVRASVQVGMDGRGHLPRGRFGDGE